MRDLRYDFEELSLGGFKDSKGIQRDYAIFATGAAIIEFDRRGEWKIAGIEIDTHAGPGPLNRSTAVLDADDMFYRTIEAILYATRSASIDEDVKEALAEEAGLAREARAEAREVA